MRLSLRSLFRKNATRRLAGRKPLELEILEDRITPAGFLDPTAAWPTFEQNDQRTGAGSNGDSRSVSHGDTAPPLAWTVFPRGTPPSWISLLPPERGCPVANGFQTFL